MNYSSHVAWYKRWQWSDPFPNKTHWTVFQARPWKACFLVERHIRGCGCSYCRGEHGHGLLWLPQDRAKGWRVLNLFHRLYVRWCP